MQDAKNWKNSHLLRRRWNLGLAVSSDGLDVYKKRSYDLWPVFLTFLNYPPHMRHKMENIFLCALFPGPSGPTDMNVLFAPLVEELIELYGGNKFDIYLYLSLSILVCYLSLSIHPYPFYLICNVM